MQIADKMIQSDKVDILTGIIWSNLAHGRRADRGCAGQVLPLAQRRPVAARRREAATRTTSTSPTRTTTCTRRRASTPDNGYKKTFILAPNYPAGKDSLTGFKRFYKGELVGEVYTKLGQTDYAAEIAADPRVGRRQRLLLPARRHGHRLHQAVSPSPGVGIPVIGPGLLVRPGRARPRSATRRSASTTPRSGRPTSTTQANKEFVAAFKAEYNRLPSLYASQGYDTAQPDRCGAGQGKRRRRRRLPRGAQGGRLRVGARQVQVQHQPAPDPGHLRARGGQGGRRPDQQDHRHRASSDHGDAYAKDCKL